MSKKRKTAKKDSDKNTTQKVLLITAVIQLIRVLIEFIVSLKE